MKIILEMLANLFRKPYTEDYPNTRRKPSERFRGRIVYDSKKCIGCQACFRNCPAKAINFRGKGNIDFDMGKCIYCGLCRDVCPVKCIEYSGEYEYADSKKDALRKNSRK